MLCDLYSTDHRSQTANHPLVMLLPSITPIIALTMPLPSCCLKHCLMITPRGVDVVKTATEVGVRAIQDHKVIE